MAAAAIPALVSVGGSLLGKVLSKPSAAQSTATTNLGADATNLSALSTQASSAAAPLFQQGSQQQAQSTGALRSGAGYLGDAGRYYRNILGDRTAATASLAPEMTSASSLYAGNANKIQRTMRGGARDYALAENDRAKVGQLASYLPTARAGAAAGMERVGAGFGQQTGQYGQNANSLFGAGSSLFGTGVNAATGAGYLNSGAFQNATTIGNQQAQTGKNIGSMIFDVISNMKKGSNPSTAFYGPAF